MHLWSCHFFSWKLQQLPINLRIKPKHYTETYKIVSDSLYHECSASISLWSLQILKPLSMFVFSYICSSALSSRWSLVPLRCSSSIASSMKFFSASYLPTKLCLNLFIKTQHSVTELVVYISVSLPLTYPHPDYENLELLDFIYTLIPNMIKEQVLSNHCFIVS